MCVFSVSIVTNMYICEMSYIYTKDIILVFIRSILFHNVGISWLIQTKYKIDFDVLMKNVLLGVKMVHGTIQLSVAISMALFFDFF